MKMKTQLSLASIIVAGLLASGCSQMSAQQVAQAAPVAAAAPAPVVKTIVDCSKCAKPAPRAVSKPKAVGKKKRAGVKKRVKRAGGGRFAHSHPAIPGCTNSITHSHPFTNAGHKHAYGCKGKRRVARPAPAPVPRQNKWAHTHPAIPGCTDSITHSHPYNNASHTHHYSCKGGHRQQMQVPVMPKVKAKGTYRGPIQIDGGVMKQYQQ